MITRFYFPLYTFIKERMFYRICGHIKKLDWNRFTARWESEIFWWYPAELRIWIFVFEQEERSSPVTDSDLSLLLKHFCHNLTTLMHHVEFKGISSVLTSTQYFNVDSWSKRWRMMTINSADRNTLGGDWRRREQLRWVAGALMHSNNSGPYLDNYSHFWFLSLILFTHE